MTTNPNSNPPQIALPQTIWIDTNILIYANLALSPFHHAAVTKLQTLDQQGVTLWISRQSLREYLSALTKPGILTAPIPIATLATDVQDFESRFLIGEDGPLVTANLLDLVMRISVRGKQIHDANIVATMLRFGVTILLTHNVTDFVRFNSVITVMPLL